MVVVGCAEGNVCVKMTAVLAKFRQGLASSFAQANSEALIEPLLDVVLSGVSKPSIDSASVAHASPSRHF